MQVFLTAVKFEMQKLFYGPSDQSYTATVKPELLVKFVQAQTKFSSQTGRTAP